MADKQDSHDEDPGFSHRYSESESQRMIESAYLSEEVRAKASYIAVKALGDLPPVCELCGEVCDEHAIKLRDAFFRRAAFLASKLWQGLDIYAREREFGVVEPVGTINSIYRFWAELVCLHDLVEPQFGDDGESEAAEPEEE